MSCGVMIPPEWKGVLAKNECPNCLEEIMDLSAQELMAELAAAMERMPADPQGLAGWLLSNYKIAKIGEAMPVEKFYSKNNVSNDYGPSEGPTSNEFFKRAGVKDMSAVHDKISNIKNPKMREIANLISNQYEEENYGEDDPSIDMGEFEQSSGNFYADEQAVSQLTNEGSLNPELIKQLANVVKNSSEPDILASFEEETRRKKIEAQQKLRSGGFKKR